jgi:hypothetical protein
VTPSEKTELILKAAIEFGADYTYEIRYGTLGNTLYIHAPNKKLSNIVRQQAPLVWNGLYVIVLYINKPKLKPEDLDK